MLQTGLPSLSRAGTDYITHLLALNEGTANEQKVQICDEYFSLRGALMSWYEANTSPLSDPHVYLQIRMNIKLCPVQTHRHPHRHRRVKVQGLVQTKCCWGAVLPVSSQQGALPPASSFLSFHLCVIRPGILVRSHVARVLHNLLTTLTTFALAAPVKALLVRSSVTGRVGQTVHRCCLCHFLMEIEKLD